VSRDLFEELMKDEEHHIDFLESQLDLGRNSVCSFTRSTTSGADEKSRGRTANSSFPSPLAERGKQARAGRRSFAGEQPLRNPHQFIHARLDTLPRRIEPRM